MPRPCFSPARLARAALLVVLAGNSVCEAQEGPQLTAGAFGTLGATYQNTPGLEYRRTTTQAYGARAGQVTLATDSLFGLQVHANISPTIQSVVEAITSLNADGNWRPRIERALIAYTPDQGIELRAGRFGFDAYPLAESPFVGYTYLPIRPAPEFFGLFSTNHLDGGDITLKTKAADGVISLRILAGHGEGNQAFANGSQVPNDSLYTGGQLGYTQGPWLAKFGYVRLRTDDVTDFNSLAAALRSTAIPQSVALASALSGPSHNTTGLQFGVAYDSRPLQLQVLLTRVDSAIPAGPRLNVGLLTAGYQLGALTPYVSYADSRSFARILPTGLPPGPAFDALNTAAIAAQKAAQMTQRTFSLGSRYVISPNFDVKVQADYVFARQSEVLFNETATPYSGVHLTVFGAAVDFIF